MRLILLAMTVLTSAAPASAEQFDLRCRHEKGETRYRVDLVRGEACSGPCDRVWKMGEASTGELKLIDKTPKTAGDLDERATVNRITGEYRYSSRIPGLGSWTESGTCEPAPFSGFPAAKF